MGYLTDADFDDLPEDDGAAFSMLEGLSRTRLHASNRDERDDLYYEDVLRYMNEISAIADEFQLSGLQWDESADNYLHEFARFTRAVDGKLAQIRIQLSRRNKRDSVLLSGNSREKMQHHLEKLKEEVKKSGLERARKAALLDKIAEFESELSKPRLSLALAMSLVALVTTTIHDGGEVLTSAPNITKAFLELIGRDKQAEIERVEALPRYIPPKRIEDQRPSSPKPSSSTSLATPGLHTTSFKTGAFGGGYADALDDDVPF